MERRGHGRSHSGFFGQPETGQRPSERRLLLRLDLEAAREASGVNDAGAYQQVADESMRAHL